MTRRTLLAAALSAVILGGTACKPAGPSRDGSGTLVSLIQLIAVPQQYDHKKVIVVGYLHLEMEGNALYLHETDFQRALTQNAVRVQFERGHEPVGSAAADGYVLVQGVFLADKGPIDIYTGRLTDIDRLERWPPPVRHGGGR